MSLYDRLYYQLVLAWDGIDRIDGLAFPRFRGQEEWDQTVCVAVCAWTGLSPAEWSALRLPGPRIPWIELALRNRPQHDAAQRLPAEEPGAPRDQGEPGHGGKLTTAHEMDELPAPTDEEARRRVADALESWRRIIYAPPGEKPTLQEHVMLTNAIVAWRDRHAPNFDATPLDEVRRILLRRAGGESTPEEALRVAEETEDDAHYPNEFLVLVGKTSKGRKGLSWGRVYRMVKDADAEWAEARVQTGLSSGQGVIHAVRDPITGQEKVKERGKAPTYVEVVTDPGVTDKRLLIYEPEYARTLRLIDQQGSILSAVLRQAWESGDMRLLNKNSPEKATNAHISVIGHCTVDELRRYLTNTEIANGFGNRHLFVCTRRSKVLPEDAAIDPRLLAPIKADLTDAISFAKSAGTMSRDAGARQIWAEVYEELSEGKPGLAGSLLARGEAHAMRLALVYALLDQSREIRDVHLLAALALWEYVEASVRFIFGDSIGDPVADEILRALRNAPQGLTRTDIRDLFGRNRSAGVYLSGAWRWVYHSGRECSVSYDVLTLDMTHPLVRLSYSWTQTATGQNESADYPVGLATTRPRFGGLRWWFVCPLLVNGWPCNRRVGKLYLPPGSCYFGCRHCYQLTYTSCQQSRKCDGLVRFLARDTGLDLATAKRALNSIGRRWR